MYKTHDYVYIYNTTYDNAVYVYAICVYDIGGCRGACRSPGGCMSPPACQCLFKHIRRTCPL